MTKTATVELTLGELAALWAAGKTMRGKTPDLAADEELEAGLAKLLAARNQVMTL